MQKYCSKCGKFHEELGTFDSKGNFVPNNSCEGKLEEKINWKKLKIPLARDFLCSISTCLSLLETDKEYFLNFVSKEELNTTIKCLTTLNSKRE